MPIAKRFAKKAKAAKRGNILRRSFSGMKKQYADNVEEYVFSLPKDPIAYTEMVVKWIIPYQEGHFTLYGQRLKLTPVHIPAAGNTVVITGILCELVHPTRPKRKKITGARGVWHGQLKFFVKTTMLELPP